MEQVETQSEVILGVDTHLDVHVGVVIDAVGRVQGDDWRLPPIAAVTSSCWIGRKTSACCVELGLKGLGPTVLD